MVRTYWLVQVFNEASWNLDLQPDRTDNQVESNSAPCYVWANGSPGSGTGGLLGRARQVSRGHVLVAVLLCRFVETGLDHIEHRQLEVRTFDRLHDQISILGREGELERGLEA